LVVTGLVGWLLVVFFFFFFFFFSLLVKNAPAAA
jgi:hypothetical protein